MFKLHRLIQDNCLLLLIDIQDKLLAVMDKKKQILRQARQLTEGCASLGIPILISEQYPHGLGPTEATLRQAAGDSCLYEKTSFGCLAEGCFADQLRRWNKTQIIIAGIESHICVHQTAMQLTQAGNQVFVAADACGSRCPEDYAIAIQSLNQMGCRIGSVEMFLFELLQNSNHPCFKTISRIIK